MLNTNNTAQVNADAASLDNAGMPPAFRPDGLQNGPKQELSFESLRDVVQKLSERDRAAITAMLDLDPEFNANGAIDTSKRGAERKVQLDALIESYASGDLANGERGVQLSADAKQILGRVVEYYVAYRDPFPDKSETEPLSSIFSYLIAEDTTWDVTIARNAEGRIIGAASGQILDNGNFLVAWNEHTWVADGERGKGLGSAIYQAFERRSLSLGAAAVMIEVDNPFALSSEPIAHDAARVAERGRYWTEEMGQSMDPYLRLNFWGKQGFRMVLATGPAGEATPAPYAQISMDYESGQQPCETIFIMMKPLDPALSKTFDAGRFAVSDYTPTYLAAQRTIDERCENYPELQRTLCALDALQGELFFAEPTGHQALAALQAGAQVDRAENALTDVSYAMSQLERAQAVLKGNLQGAPSEAEQLEKRLPYHVAIAVHAFAKARYGDESPPKADLATEVATRIGRRPSDLRKLLEGLEAAA